MNKLTEWRLTVMPIGTELELIYEEDVCFLEKLSGTLTNNDFCGFVEITDSEGREFILEYDIIREVRINRRLESILWQTPPGAKVRFSWGSRENRVPNQEGTVVENDMDSYLAILTDQGIRRYRYHEIRSFLVGEIPAGAASKARNGLSWRVPRDYLKLSDKTLQDTFLMLPRKDKRKMGLSYEQFVNARRKGSLGDMKQAARQMKRMILWEEEKGDYWSCEAVCLCGAMLHLVEETDHEIYLVGECFGAAALACWKQGLYTLGGAYAILSALEENPCCTEDLAIILAAGIVKGKDISGLEKLAQQVTPEMEPYLERILEEAFQVCGLSRPVDQSVQESLEVLRPLFQTRDMAEELAYWGESKEPRVMPGLQISRAPRLCGGSTPIPAAG